MNILAAHSPRWANAAGDAIDLVVHVDGWTVPIPFSARAEDPEAHGRDLFARAVAGEFGPVTAYSEPILPADVVVKLKTALIDAHIRSVLNARGYDGQHSIAKYQGLTDAQIAGLPADEQPFATTWRAECHAAALWIVRAYAAGLKVLADVQAGTRPPPTDEALIADLPVMVWPE